MMTRPQDMTEEEHDRAVKWLTDNCDPTELRRRQALTERQIEHAFRHGLTEELQNLRMMEKHLQTAILWQVGLWKIA